MSTPPTIVLVEGRSDQNAVEAAARRCGYDLASRGVTVCAMGGATNIDAWLGRVARDQPSARVLGLVDEAQLPVFARALRRAGLGDDPAAAGFFTCVADLEDELIRALGVPTVLALLADQGDLLAYRRFCGQPAQRDRTDQQRLHRFLGTRSGRKIHYGSVLVDALDPARLPEPLRALVERC